MVVDHFLIPTIYIVRDRLKLTDDQTGVLTSFISSAPELSVSMISLFLAIKANDAEMFAQIASMGPGAVIGSALFSVLFIV
jgi:Sodium/calcium exchanger protein